jgi:Fic-DOC domain mobile mystery protein B
MKPGETLRAEVPISAGERNRLLPSLSTRAQLEEIERRQINAARVWAMRRAVLSRGDLMTENFARELHRRMFGGIWRGAGRFRTAKLDRGWEPRQIPEGVRMFLDDAEGWLRYSTYSVHEAALRLHVRLIAIHPWFNGNGRHARLVADIVVAANDAKPLAWGSASARPGRGDARARYIEAMDAAASGDIEPLLEFALG